MLRRGSGVPLALGTWQAPRFYVYEAGEVPGVPKDLLYIKESAWGPAAAQVGPAPVFLGKHLELQATQTNKTPLRGRKTIELGAGCGLVSMVAALLGADAHACEENGPTLALLQHNVATFNSEFTKCHPIRSGEFPTSETLRGFFDLIFVTDLLNSPSARVKTLKCLLHLLGARTECIIVHAWRSPEAEKTFFEALGKCLIVSRLDGQRDIQKRCMQAISRSISDSARDIHEATDEDGSIDIFSVKPHADVSESVWRADVKDLLLKLLREEATQKCNEPEDCTHRTDSHATHLETETGAKVRDAAPLCSEEKATGRNAASFSSCSTLTSMQTGVHFAHITPSYGVITPAENWAPDEDNKVMLGHLSHREAVKSGSAARAAKNGANTSPKPGLLRTMSQPLLNQRKLPVKNTQTVTGAAETSKITPKIGATVTASSREPGFPADAARVRPKTSTTATAVARGGDLHIQKRTPVNRDGSLQEKKAAATASEHPISPRLSPVARGRGKAAAAPKTTISVTGKILRGNLKPTHPEPQECSGGTRSTALTAATPEAAAKAATLQQAAAANLQNSIAMRAMRPTTLAETMSADATTVPQKPAPVGKPSAELVRAARPAVLKAAKSGNPRTCAPAPQLSSKRMGPLLPALGAPSAQPRRATADGSPTGPHKAAVAYAPLRPRRDRLLGDAGSSAEAAATTPATAPAAATAALTTAPTSMAKSPTLEPAPAFYRCAAPNTGKSQRLLTLGAGAASGNIPSQPSVARPGESKASTRVTGKGSPKFSSATGMAPKPIADAVESIAGTRQAVNTAPRSANAAATKPEAPKPAAVAVGAIKADAVAAAAQGQSDKPHADGERIPNAAPVGFTIAPRPLGARLVSRLSGLFKRSGSKELKNK